MASKKTNPDASTDELPFDVDAAPAGEGEGASNAGAPDAAEVRPADASHPADAAGIDADDAVTDNANADAAAEPATDHANAEPDAAAEPAADHANAEPADAEAHDADDPEQDAVARLRAQRDEWRDRHLRLAADFDNYRKRSDERMRTRWDRAQADLVSRLLDPMDDLLRISELGPETSAAAEAVLEGAELVERKFFRILEEIGVEVVDPQGEPFDPNVMEAMMRAPADSDEDDDMVERVFQKGYVLKGQLLRPARVSVYKAG